MKAVLRGREHHKLGAIGTAGDGRAAAALSLGGARKTYGHTDPNEDAAGVARGEHGVLLVVADGHHGHRAAELAVETLLERFAAPWIDDDTPLQPVWETCACEALRAVSETILAETGGARASRTTLVFAAVRPGEGRVMVASLGDSLAFLATPERSIELTGDPDAPGFLGYEHETTETLRRKAELCVQPLTNVRAVVLATDGLSEYAVGVDDAEAAVTDAVARGATADPDERALLAAQELAAIACEAHRRNPSGDNVATAVAWL